MWMADSMRVLQLLDWLFYSLPKSSSFLPLLISCLFKHTRFTPLSLVNNTRQSYHSPGPSTFIAATRQTITLVPRFRPH